MRRRGSGRVPFRALCLRKFTLKARPRLSGRVLAESIALFRNTFETRHSPYYIRYHTFYVKSNDFYTAIFTRCLSCASGWLHTEKDRLVSAAFSQRLCVADCSVFQKSNELLRIFFYRFSSERRSSETYINPSNAQDLLYKSRGETRPSRFSFIGDARKSSALLGFACS